MLISGNHGEENLSGFNSKLVKLIRGIRVRQYWLVGAVFAYWSANGKKVLVSQDYFISIAYKDIFDILTKVNGLYI